ncbi:lipopolysaccharide biosynthesis protein [Agrococcus lahaulensis]|uniref:lipopolysaccharide biosynthesis protein n=1 Tax=Agrococcus lahaulensis TaxID=341722 RepID=UPI00040FE66E|nr:hypothetical protein [Agrococcus lahaulensis]
MTGATSARAGLGGVGAATIFSALSGYAVLFVAARSLGAERYDIFAVYWAAFFALTGIVNGLMHETTRAVHAARAEGRGPAQAGGARPTIAACLIGGAVAVVVLASSPLWAEDLVPQSTGLGVGLLALAIASFALQAALSGALSGSGRWGHYAVLLAVDAGLRLVVALAAVWLGAPEVGLLIATVCGSLTWLLLVCSSPAARAALRLRADVAPGPFFARIAQAMFAASATAALVVGFPVLLKAAATDEDPAMLGGLILAVTLTRAPLLVPLTSFQNAIVVHFADRRASGAKALALPVAAVLGVAAAGAAAAWAVGPPILAFMGEGFEVPGPVLALLTMASGTTAALFLSGSAALAHEVHGSYVLGWWAATLASLGLLLVPLDLTSRTVLALSAGPLLGLGWHAVAIAWTRRSR